MTSSGATFGVDDDRAGCVCEPAHRLDVSLVGAGIVGGPVGTEFHETSAPRSSVWRSRMHPALDYLGFWHPLDPQPGRGRRSFDGDRRVIVWIVNTNRAQTSELIVVVGRNDVSIEGCSPEPGDDSWATATSARRAIAPASSLDTQTWYRGARRCKRDESLPPMTRRSGRVVGIRRSDEMPIGAHRCWVFAGVRGVRSVHGGRVGGRQG